MSTITTAASFGSASNWSGSFIPSLWSAKMIQKFYATSVFGDIANTDYEGEIKGYGDKVVITTSSIFGIKKVTFTHDGVGAQDFGLFSLDTAAANR